MLFRSIMVPLELAHAGHYEKTLSVACDLSRQYDAPITIVGVPGRAPNGTGNGAVDTRELDRFASEQKMLHGVPIAAMTMRAGKSHGSLTEMLDEQVWAVGADLVLLAPALSSNGDDPAFTAAQYLISVSSASVFVVR